MGTSSVQISLVRYEEKYCIGLGRDSVAFSRLRGGKRELKQWKFSGRRRRRRRRRLEWQREAGTDVAVASRQIQLFKRQVHSDGDGVAFQRKK